jgi:membrane AbrB-like protein
MLGLAFALAFDALNIPGGLVLGGTTGAALVSVVGKVDLHMPRRFDVALQILLGVLVGTRITPDFSAQLGTFLVPAVTTSFVLILAGLATAHLLHRFTGEAEWITLATCPGGLETLLTVALERDEGPVEVGLFHVVRVVAVVASLPLLLLTI